MEDHLQCAIPAPRAPGKPCDRCAGTGKRLTSEWRRWWDLYAAAEEAYRAEYPEEDWATSSAFWAVHNEMPPGPETAPCARCLCSGWAPVLGDTRIRGASP